MTSHNSSNVIKFRRRKPLHEWQKKQSLIYQLTGDLNLVDLIDEAVEELFYIWRIHEAKNKNN